MVSITIYVEGGVLPNSNASIATVSGTQQLREGFSKLFRQILSEKDYNLKIEPSGGYKSAASRFKSAISANTEEVLLIDLDGPKTEKKARLSELSLSEYSACIFFMVQEMEAWMLAQPAQIEEYAKVEQLLIKDATKRVVDNILIKGKDVEAIKKPSVKLKTIFEQHFQVEKKSKPKKRTYGKLKDAAGLLELLDLKALRAQFEDVDNLILYIENRK